METINVAVIGGGDHSSANHLPALAKYVALNPGNAKLAAFCDLRREVAENVSREYGFARIYTDLEEMLGAERLDACIAVTPISATAAVAMRIISAGIPLLMEKPPGATPGETARICNLAESRNARVMVSMNRRFDPAIVAARSWKAEHPFQYLRATMLRHARREADFFTGTAIHCVDAVRSIAGDIRDYSVRFRQAEGVSWYCVDVEFSNHATGTLEVMPNCGSHSESYEIFGAGYRLLAIADGNESENFTAWENGRIAKRDVPTEEMPRFVRNGTYAETIEFLSAVRENRNPSPSPTEVRQSVEICRQIQQTVKEQTAQKDKNACAKKNAAD